MRSSSGRGSLEGSSEPVRYGAVARGEFFTDREPELKSLVEDVRGGQDVVIISPRRLGKTSLVDRAIEQLRGEGAPVAYLDLLGSPSKEVLADDLGQALKKTRACSRRSNARPSGSESSSHIWWSRHG